MNGQWIHDKSVIENLHFNKPTQVAFIDDQGYEDLFGDKEPATVGVLALEDGALGGIAYGNEVICGCCGAALPLEDIAAIMVYNDFIDISAAILGN